MCKSIKRQIKKTEGIYSYVLQLVFLVGKQSQATSIASFLAKKVHFTVQIWGLLFWPQGGHVASDDQDTWCEQLFDY